MRKLTLLTLLALAALPLPVAHAAKSVTPPAVPYGFVGMNADGPLLSPQVNLGAQLGAMSRGGVDTIRTAFYWSQAQPVSSFIFISPADAPLYTDVGGIPTNFSATDTIVGTAARHGITILPDVQQAPAWASRHPGNPASPPSGTVPYGNFMAALAKRYGPNGTFWKANPSLHQLPIRDWQIWNEPDATKYWSDQPFVADYVALLKAAHTALRGVDPGARAVLAGFPSRSWVSLARLYKAGARPYFDVAAVHPFSLPVTNITRILKEDRRVMAKYHDSRKPMFITETSWPSALGRTTTKYGFEVTRSGEAAKARAVLQLLAAEREQFNLERVYWYTWISLDASRDAPFDYAGLQTFTPANKLVKKPAYKAFTQTALQIEGCRSRGPVATRKCRRAK
jgi:hypothetical protein